MEEDLRDRISELPDAILDSILSKLPLKHMIQTSILSTRWSNLWKHTLHHATTFDFGKEFAKAQKTPHKFVTTVNKYLQLHNTNNIDIFHLYFHPGADQNHKADVEKWITFAGSKEVKNLFLIFCRELEVGYVQEPIPMPDAVFNCNLLKHFSASHMDFILPSQFNGFDFVESIQLNRVSITDETLASILSCCPMLTNLCLKVCSDLEHIRISGPNLKLECLSLIANPALEIEIFAPNLKTLHFYGDVLYEYSFLNVDALEDFFISAYGYECSEPEHDFVQILVGVSNVKILTVCIGTPMRFAIWKEFSADVLPVSLTNLHELHIVVGGEIGEEYLGYIFVFLEEIICPYLEKLFIDLSGFYVPWEPHRVKEADEPSSCVFDSLKLLKINHFRGTETEMKMMKFFLDRAGALELLVFVAAPDSSIEQNDSTPGPSIEVLKILLDQLLLLPKASGKVQVLLFNYGEADTSSCPVHTPSDYYVDDICCY